jgi:hypothetical protein
MKFKTTKKTMRENYHYIIGTGYCNAQYLLQYEEPRAYSTRAEGWACDYYDIDKVLISTGYAPLSNSNTKCTYDIVRRYDDAAQAITGEYEERKTATHALLQAFIKEVTQ